jgi:protein gp37
MAERSAIEWTGGTWNVVTGCSKVSPGCARCYIERTTPFRVQGRRFMHGTTDIRLHPERLERKHALHPSKLQDPVFVCSLADLFHDQVPAEYVLQVFDVMAATRERTFQVLTKRPERALQILSSRAPAANVWLGVSVENSRFTWRADVLREIPAAVRFISAEPLIGSVFESRGVSKPLDLAAIDWLIAGGESGPGYRPVQLEWLRELRDACAANGVAFFFKQWGGRTAKSGGRELDDRTHDDMPWAKYA